MSQNISTAVEAHDIISRAEAKAQGLVRYFTGFPCKNRHLAEPCRKRLERDSDYPAEVLA